MALRGTNQEFGRPYNRRIVLETIRLHGPVTRADIADRVGLTIQTVSNIVRELEERGFLVAHRGAPKGRGSPAESLTVNPDGGYAVGIDITPIGLEAVLTNLTGAIVGRERRDLDHADPDTAFDAIETLVAKLVGVRPDGRMLGVGMAIPGPFDVESMSFVGPTTMEGWTGVPLRRRLKEATGLPSFIEGIAASAHGERLFGAGRDFRDFYYLYFGVGFGGCMVHDGMPLRGAFGNAGEIGHMPVVPDGDLCPCGNRGCLERYVSIEAYERRAPDIGDDAWVAEVTPLLRSAIVTIENLFDPETIILNGLGHRSLLQKLIAATGPFANSVSARTDRTAPRILLSDGGYDAVLRGAAALAVSGALSPRFGVMFAERRQRSERDPIMLDAGRAA
ncbi:MAG: ROK family protein [Hyphomicrobiales bacterium]|nr:ROK family protein [Hyphomicrobiales bacterium]